MFEAFPFLHVPSMVLMVVVLYAALALVLVYTYACRRTYPGFGAMTVAQVLWVFGLFINYYRVLGDDLSLFLGNNLMLLYGVFLFFGLSRYGEVSELRSRTALNVALYIAAAGIIGYYHFVEFDTCRRAAVYSTFSAIIYCRIALEPCLSRSWRTYATQGVFSGIFFLFGIVFALRAVQTWQATDCPVTSPDGVAKLLLLLATLLSPLFIFCILSMTSSRVEAELREARDALRHLAETDPLTGLCNRRHFLELVTEALTRARETGGVVGLVMLDLDHFKRINDTHGHQAGDMVLREVGRRLREELRDEDVVGRLGGEEFGIMLRGLGEAEALAVARRLREAVADLLPGGMAVTASLGVAAGTQDVDTLLGRADEYLYAAKRAGRNRVAGRGDAALAAGDAAPEEVPA